MLDIGQLLLLALIYWVTFERLIEFLSYGFESKSVRFLYNAKEKNPQRYIDLKRNTLYLVAFIGGVYFATLDLSIFSAVFENLPKVGQPNIKYFSVSFLLR